MSAQVSCPACGGSMRFCECMDDPFARAGCAECGCGVDGDGECPCGCDDEPIRTQVTASVHSRGAIVPERQRCTCPMFLCRPECRACNHSGRDLEEMCIADPDWEPDDEYLAIREDRFRGGVR